MIKDVKILIFQLHVTKIVTITNIIFSWLHQITSLKSSVRELCMDDISWETLQTLELYNHLPQIEKLTLQLQRVVNVSIIESACTKFQLVSSISLEGIFVPYLGEEVEDFIHHLENLFQHVKQMKIVNLPIGNTLAKEIIQCADVSNYLSDLA